jgi:two-component system sensor histidine kinase/response regulator
MNDHVAKPIDPEDLFRALLKWVKPKQSITPISSSKTAQKEVEKNKPVEGLPLIAGLDVELGLQRVVGKKPLYLNMLRKYVNGQINTPTQFREALDANDFETAERVIHSSKGVSGNIGAIALQNMAAEIETLVREKTKRAVIDEKFVPFSQALMTMVEDIKQALPSDESQANQVVVDTEKTTDILIKLAALLADDDSDASDVVEENLDALRVVLGAEAFSKIDRAIKQYDFDSALELLKERTITIGIVLP